MDRIDWKDSYAISEAELDYQHQKLFELVNLFFETTGMTRCTQLIKPVFRGLITYTQNHFTAEEACMQRQHIRAWTPIASSINCSSSVWKRLLPAGTAARTSTRQD